MKPGHKAKRKILGVISVTRAEQMLTEWVNTDLVRASGIPHAWERFFRNYPEVLPVPVESVVPFIDVNLGFLKYTQMADHVAHFLRKAWEAGDQRSFDWYTWTAQTRYEWEAVTLRHDLIQMQRKEGGGVIVRKTEKHAEEMEAATKETNEPPPVITPVEAAIFHLRHNRYNARHCQNPECPAPYFFRSKTNQKFCSPECAKPSLRESKRAWWAANRAKEKP